MKQAPFRAVSLFSNCGAGDVGYAKAGFKFEVMAELDPRRLEVSLLNHPNATGVAGDLCKTWPKVIEEYRKRAGNARPALLAACPPCQGMSSARSGRGKSEDADAGSRDTRNFLVTVVERVAQELKPDVVVLENVPAFLTRKIRHPKTAQPISAARYLSEQLADDYELFPVTIDLCEYGVPQTRRRTFLTFVRRDVPGVALLTKWNASPYPVPSYAADFKGESITVEDALKRFGFPSLDARSPRTASSKIKGGLHSVPVWGEERYQMVAAIPKRSGLGAWTNDSCPRCGKVNVTPKCPVCPICDGPLNRPVLKKKDGQYRLIKGFHSSTYHRMKANEPAATITTASGHVGSNYTIHPYENRLLSTLECARLQTFPATFKWGRALKKWGHTNIREMIGEAVPPMFTNKHGKVLAALLGGWMKLPLLPTSNRRVQKAKKMLGLAVAKNAAEKIVV